MGDLNVVVAGVEVSPPAPDNAAAMAAAKALPAGWITLAGLPPYTLGLKAALRGKIALWVNGVEAGTLWEGYITAAGQPFSQPNVYVDGNGWGVLLTVSGSTAFVGASALVKATVVVSDNPGPASRIYQQPVGPAAGPGDVSTIDLTDPAADADYPIQTVGAKTLERVNAVSQAASTNTTAGGYVILFTDGTNQYAIAPPSITVGAGGSQRYGWNYGSPTGRTGTTSLTVASQTVPGSIPQHILRPTHTWKVARELPNVLDDAGQAYAQVERWAVIA